MKKYAAFIMMVVLLVLVNCAPSEQTGYFVTHAEAVDWVWGVEELGSGAARIWLRYDNIAGYCTVDPQLVALAKDTTGDLVKITFESVKWDSAENGYDTGCTHLSTGSYSSTPIFKLTSIERLDN